MTLAGISDVGMHAVAVHSRWTAICHHCRARCTSACMPMSVQALVVRAQMLRLAMAAMYVAARMLPESETRICAVQASALCAVALGLCMGEAGVSIMHDVNHGAGLRSRSARYVLGTAMDLVSARLASHAHTWYKCISEKVASVLEPKL